MQTISSNPTTFRLIRRRLTSTLLAIAVFAGTIATTAQPAYAASSVSGCFVMSDGWAPTKPYRVYLMWYNASLRNWYSLNDGYRLGTNGCVSIPVTLGYYNVPVTLYVYDGNYGGTFYGWSSTSVGAGNFPMAVGRGIIRYHCAGVPVAAC